VALTAEGSIEERLIDSMMRRSIPSLREQKMRVEEQVDKVIGGRFYKNM
jgi:hypothetical protein